METTALQQRPSYLQHDDKAQTQLRNMGRDFQTHRLWLNKECAAVPKDDLLHIIKYNYIIYIYHCLTTKERNWIFKPKINKIPEMANNICEMKK